MSDFVAGAMGLHFPRERWPDLQRGLAKAAIELGFHGPDGPTACAERLLSAPPSPAQLQALANHLTIGETYFFRGKKTFDALAGGILPALIRSRQSGVRARRLRLWSAACCTGEEAYSLAILLRQLLPGPADWDVRILATDINARFLAKAKAGVYSEWSFRDAPEGLKERYFTRNADGRYAVTPEIREWVTFAPLNLVENFVESREEADPLPLQPLGADGMDLIFCRNALMYFAPAQARKAVANLHRALATGGWLAVSPSEASQTLFSQFTARNFPGAVLYRKGGAEDGERSRSRLRRPRLSSPPAPAPVDNPRFSSRPAPPLPEPFPAPSTPPPPPPRSPYAEAAALYQRGRYAEAAEKLLPWATGRRHEPEAFSLLARALANQGKLADALLWCDRWIAADKLDPSGHYLRAVALLEQNQPDPARRSLLRAVYLAPDFVLAHFTLGSLERGLGKREEADRHFANASRLLGRMNPEEILSESDGLTAGRLIRTLDGMAAMEAAR